MERHKTYPIVVNKSFFNDEGLKINNYPKLLSTLGYEHLKDTDQGVNVILKDKYAWAIVVMKLHILTPIKSPLTLTGKTWYSGRRGPYYRREYELSYNGKSVLTGASYSILLNVLDRSVFRQKTLPFNPLVETNIHLTTLTTSFRDDFNYTFIKEDTVKDEHIDALGHTNHLNYVKFIYKALSKEDRLELNTYNTLELFFQKEMLKGDVFTINKGYKDDFLLFLIYNKTRAENAFILKVSKEPL